MSRFLSRRLTAGLLGAELATWAAVSPSLLPRPWWVTAANVAIGQAVGHCLATAVEYGATAVLEYLRPARPHERERLADRLSPRSQLTLHGILGVGSVVVGVISLRNQQEQAALVGKSNDRGPATAVLGALAGTLGYGVLLIVGEAIQATVTGLSAQAQRWLPRGVASPLAVVIVTLSTVTLSDQWFWRRFIRNNSLRAQRLNQLVFPDSMMPWEPERSGSPWSHEPWTAVGAQGRRFLTRGPRAADITQIMGEAPAGEHAREPIRVFIGLVPGRGMASAARLAYAELERTGAFRRDTLVIAMPAGSGWLNNYAACAYEFLTRGDCATVTLQYSYLPSVFSFVVDRSAPIHAAGELLELILTRIALMDPHDRPKVYLSAESLGAYALLENFDSLEALLDSCDGAVFTGPPRMTPFLHRLLARRDPASLERLPVINGGRHVRFAAVPAHLHADAFGAPYPQPWQRPRVLIAQHTSDPIVWWDTRLIYSRPAWISEPTPPDLHADTFRRLVWVPFITFWQVALDQINSLNVPGGHGHNYFDETLWYWDAVLGSQTRAPLTPQLARQIGAFIRRTQPRG